MWACAYVMCKCVCTYLFVVLYTPDIQDSSHSPDIDLMLDTGEPELRLLLRPSFPSPDTAGPSHRFEVHKPHSHRPLQLSSRGNTVTITVVSNNYTIPHSHGHLLQTHILNVAHNVYMYVYIQVNSPKVPCILLSQ